jgi:hypothetical protein
MKERPILFSAPMVRSIREDRKWQTRRVLKNQPTFASAVPHTERWTQMENGYHHREVNVNDKWIGAEYYRCPHGQPGDRLWVRETYTRLWFNEIVGWQTYYKADDNLDFVREAAQGQWKPSIFMPRKYSRDLLELTAVRVERLQEISADDCRAEGMRPDDELSLLWRENIREKYRILWDSLNKKRGYDWEGNPWVFVETFERVAP